jgi:iron complex transport system substrate-binding protein
MRIVSLLPSATEIVCALGLQDDLVGVSHECDHPPEISGRPVVTEAKVDASGASAEIDRSVRRLVADGLGVYRIRTDLLAQLDADVILTQEQCDVCAVSFEEVVRAAQEVLRPKARIVSLEARRLADIAEDIRRVADAVDRREAGIELAAGLHERLEAIRVRAARARFRPRVGCIEWLQPLMAAGNWIPELVDIAGGTYEPVQAGDSSRELPWTELAALAPDVLVLMPCGFKLEQTRLELPLLLERPEWARLPAVRNGRVYAVDGNAYLNRPGPRIAESAELLAGLIQPGLFAARIPPDSYFRIVAGSRRRRGGPSQADGASAGKA